MAAKKKAVEAVLTKLIGLVRKKSANIRAIEKGEKKLPGAKADRDKELNRLKDDLDKAKERVRKQKAKVEGAKDAPPKALDEGPTKKSLKKKRKAVRDEPKDRKGPKAKQRIAEEDKLNKRMQEKDAAKSRRQRAKSGEDEGIIQRLEDRKQEEIAIRRGGNKGRDFEAKVDSEQAGRGAYRKAADFRRQEMAKQKSNYARQKARSEDSSLTPAERRAASEEMRKLRARYGNEVTKGGGEKLMRRPAPKKRTPIGGKKKPEAKAVSLRDAFNKAKAADQSSFSYDGQKYSVSAVADRFKKAEEKFGMNKGGMAKKGVPVITIGVGMAKPSGKKSRTGSTDYRNGGMVMASIDNLTPAQKNMVKKMAAANKKK